MCVCVCMCVSVVRVCVTCLIKGEGLSLREFNWVPGVPHQTMAVHYWSLNSNPASHLPTALPVIGGSAVMALLGEDRGEGLWVPLSSAGSVPGMSQQT